MTNAQLYLAIGLPCLTVMTVLVISLLQISGIRADMRAIRDDIRSLTGKVAEMAERGRH
jgi:hypothetical protein